MIVVDKMILFMGGLDLCWGRMDGNNHPLFNDKNSQKFPGVDYYNPLKKDIVKGRDYQKSMIEPTYPRMPWHDIAIMIVGKVVADFVLHFNAYWNHAKETNGETEVLFNSQQGPGPNNKNMPMFAPDDNQSMSNYNSGMYNERMVGNPETFGPQQDI